MYSHPHYIPHNMERKAFLSDMWSDSAAAVQMHGNNHIKADCFAQLPFLLGIAMWM
jgi:hypothetical protein